MTERVVIMGPISPAEVEHLLTGRDRSVAYSIRGYRGIPVSELVKAFVAMDIQVEVVTEAPDVEATVELEGPRLKLFVAPMRPSARDRAKDLFRREREEMTSLLKKTEGDVIHANWTYEFALAALDTGRPALVTAHDAPMTIFRHVPDAYRAARTAMAWLVRMRMRQLVAVSPYLAKRWRREMLYRREIAVIPNIAPDLRLSSPPSGSSAVKRLVTIGNSSPVKNIPALIEALRLLRAEGRAVELDAVGPGLGLNDALAKEVRESGRGDGIEFHGALSREALAEVLSRGALLVHPSFEECCPTSLLEAMHAGVPIIGGLHSGGVPWVLANGEAGVLVNIKKPVEIAHGIARLLDDEGGARVIASRAREHVAENFSAEVVCGAYLAAYERARAEQ
ncbi:MAG: glycosyltransferase family 4 protein [Gaiellaceae bacterium]|jgi:glycosyltransferase involved in cell wall biosynthesis